VQSQELAKTRSGLPGVATICLAVVAATSSAQPLTRGPYLQLAGPTSITVVFRTEQRGIGRVRFGEKGQPLSRSVEDVEALTEHVLRLTGLQPSTLYDYVVELGCETLAAGPEYRFRTYPPVGSTEAFRVFAWGDSGTGEPGQLKVAHRMANALNGATLAMILGDIIYPYGEAKDYDPKFFVPYASMLRRMVVWPVIGNHDIDTDPTGGPWLDAFHTPANNPLSTELYYSFDYANAHFVVLDTHVSDFFSPDAPQLRWAAADLAASKATWKTVAFHVPPYSGGTHFDNAFVQSNIVPVLENAGVDLVLAGHSHVYERTFLLKQNAIVQNARNSYVKGDTGTLYVVSGAGGKPGPLGDPAHPLMAFQLGSSLGTTVIDFEGDALHGYFLIEDGTAVDLFRFTKGPDTRGPVLVAAQAKSETNLEATFNEPVLSGSVDGSAERVAAWAITPPIPILQAQLLADGRTVTLTTAPHPAKNFSLTVFDVADRSLPANTTRVSRTSYRIVPPAPDPKPDLVLVGAPTALRYQLGTAAPPTTWAAPACDSVDWAIGELPIGFGEPNLATSVEMNRAVTLYTRMPFQVPDVGVLESLELDVDFDDGFVAFLNGREVARRGVPPMQTFETVAENHESGTAERFPLAPPAQVLRSGANLLAIELHNRSIDSRDLFLQATLRATLSPQAPDGGDAGPSSPDGGRRKPDIPRPSQCRCDASPLGLWAVFVVSLFRRRPSPNSPPAGVRLREGLKSVRFALRPRKRPQKASRSQSR
jgi:hypothetical protein